MDKEQMSFENLDLIEFIEERAEMWDKFSDEYKDNNKREEAWDEIASLLLPTYDNKSMADKKSTGTVVHVFIK